ncbi:MAG: TetR/AcrR family transcriptional regulator [Desulfobacterales bacterium]|nr:MAG: TetR/AcrR family transcriptional regulator [Desulfobacterales bacterium]
MSEIEKSSSPLRISPQPTLKIGKSERTRAAILNGALGLIWSHPFRDMTVSSLMASTGMSRSAFYQYFNDLHELMETLLDMLQQEIFDVAEPWLVGVGDPVTLLRETLAGLVQVCYQRGPFLRAITDAATTDSRLENAWLQFLAGFDDAATARIEADQKQGLIPDFEARPVAFALNRLNAYTLLQAFGQHPRKQPEPVREALARVWISTLYGSEWFGNESSDLVRK